MSKTIAATLHHFQYSSASDAGYKEMVKQIKANADGRGHCMECLHDPKSGRTKPHGTIETVEIETEHLFGNQWNTADGRRVFDWYEGVVYNSGVRGNCRFGHWLEINPELAEIRRSTLKCGYCGHHYGPDRELVPASGFCDHCMDSPYLKESEVYLLRLLPVIEPEPKRQPLTEAESAELMPKYVERQTISNRSRAVEKRAKQREKIQHDYEVDSTNAKNERDGMIWLLDRNYDIENVIYYKHTGKFCFGWRNPLSEAVKSKLSDLLCEFPFDYEIDTGKKK